MRSQKVLYVWFASFALLMIGFALVGEYRSYTPIPLQDSWDGSFTFFYALLEQGPTQLLQKHNEHRIILSRILFFLNHIFFNGANWPLRAANVIFAGVAAYLLSSVLMRLTKRLSVVHSQLIALFIFGILFSWVQEDNLVWEFQGQFFLAQLIPLSAFYWLYRSAQASQNTLPFIVVMLFGAASYGTMANGVLAMPLIIVLALLLGISRARILLLVIIAVLCTTLYFRGFSSNSANSLFIDTIKNHPFGFIEYVLLYLGNPFFHIFHSVNVALISGAAFLILLFYFLSYGLRPHHRKLELVLVFFLMYVLATALITAGGRLHLGLYSAFTPRYTTPALMAWAAIFILAFAALPSKKSLQWGFFGLLLFLSLGFLRFQFQVFAPQYPLYAYQQKVAGLALELNIRDQAMNRTIYPDEHIYEFAQQVYSHQSGFFGQQPYQNLRKQLATHINLNQDLPSCRGQIDALEVVGDQNSVDKKVNAGDRSEKYWRVRGWMINEKGDIDPLVKILNTQFDVIGFALGGDIRPDLNDRKVASSGFMGYLRNSELDREVVLTNAAHSCAISVKMPPKLYSQREVMPSPDLATIGQNNAIDSVQWRGSDEERSAHGGMKVYGSYLNSAKDVGSLTLKMKRGDKLFYKGGGVSGNQTIDIVGTSLNGLLPYSPRWSNWYILDFNSELLPSGEFIVRLNDSGKGYGEWSAITVKQQSDVK